MERVRQLICEKIMRRPSKEVVKKQPLQEEPNGFYRRVVARPGVRDLLKRLAQK